MCHHRRAIIVSALVALLLSTASPASAEVGFADGGFSGTSAPSGMKPQSKLWFADGIWWSVMFNNLAQRFEIYRRNAATEKWASTATIVDGRRNVWADAKWDGTKLFVVTHGASWTSTLDGIRVSRFSYNSATKAWSADSGFPLLDVGTTPGHTAPTGTEGAVLDEDSRGRIWITWTRDLKTWVTHSTTDTRTFAAPFVVPVPGADGVTADDMSTLVAYDGRIGVLWSNESTWCMCFAIHDDAAPDDAWTAKPMIGPAADPTDKAQELADDHMNLKAPNDGSGMVYASSKTSLDGMHDPLLLFNVFDGTSWAHYTYATVAEQTTRAQIALDMEHRQVYMLGSAPCCNGGIEYYKQSTLTSGRIAFPPGLGTPFISLTANTHVNNVSTTKQALSSSTGLVAIAGDDTTKTYVHNTIDLSRADTSPPDTTLDSGPSGTDNNPDARFEFSSSESGSSFECSLDGGAFSACTSPKAYLAVGDGVHGFRVRAVDAAGNVDPTPATRSWTVENTATLVDITAESDTYATSGTPNGNFGTATTLTTDGPSSSDPASKQSFFRFTVAGTRKIVSAKVRTWVTDGSVGGPRIYSTSTTWGESTLTWNNRPAPIGAALAANTGAVAKGGYLDYDISPAVKANGTYAFLTDPSSSDAVVVASRENAAVARPPVLQLRIDPPPDTNVESGPDAIGGSSSATLAFSSTDPGSSFACKLDAGAYAPCSPPKTYTGLADGAHTFSVKATDPNGAEDPSPATYAWTVDTAAPPAPTLTLTADSDTGASASDHVTSDVSPTLTGSAQPGTAVTVDAGAMQLGTAVADAAGNWTLFSEDLAPGSYSLTATAQDLAGNVSAPSAALDMTIDTTPPPDPVIETPPADLTTRSPDLTIAGTADTGAVVEVRDGTAVLGTATAGANGSWHVDVTGLADGVHQISALARDLAGNASGAAGRTVTVDTTPPDTTITSGPPDPASSGDATFRFSATETGSSFQCSLDGSAYDACSSPHGTSVGAGTHTFAVRAVDQAGNSETTAATWSWTVNTSLPGRPSITAPADGSRSATSTVTVAGTADAGVTIKVFDGAAAAGSTTADAQGDWTLEVADLPDGAHTFTATAGNGGGTSAASPPVTVTIDTVAPPTTIDARPQNPARSDTATFDFSSADASATFECRIDGSSWAPCTSPRTLGGLADGDHTFEVRAVDAAGNRDATPAAMTWTIDTATPDTSITSGPSGTVASADATFAFGASEAGSTFECRLDDGDLAQCTSPRTMSNLAPGAHTFEVRAVDAAGNADPSPARRTWHVQQTVFSDGFETGALGPAWARQVGADGTAGVVSDVVKTGSFAAGLTATINTGSFSLLRYTLASPAGDVTVGSDVQVAAEGASGGNVPIVRLYDATGTRVLSLYRQNASADRIYVSYGATTALTTGRLPLNTWGRFTVRMATGAAGAGVITVTLNGTTVYTTTTATLDAAGVAFVQLGNETKKQAFRLFADDVSVTVQ
jgi:hypothetical protein